MIPTIDIAPLFGPDGPARHACDAAIMAAATTSGFLQITGPAALIPTDRAALLRIFTIPAATKARLSRRSFVATNSNVYRGWFPLQSGHATYKEGIDIGPDLLPENAARGGADPLLEPTPLPDDAELPGWRAAAADYYRAMERLGRMLMRAIARGLDLPETRFDADFAGGISTLRLIRYPPRPQAPIAGAPHVDSGFVTLLAQDRVPGLQAQDHAGAWIDVPPRDGALAVNFGALLERWTGGRIRATRHQVLGGPTERCSIPFFYEPRADARITSLQGDADAASFLYGDHLWAAMTKFVEFRGMEQQRSPALVDIGDATPR